MRLSKELHIYVLILSQQIWGNLRKASQKSLEIKKTFISLSDIW